MSSTVSEHRDWVKLPTADKHFKKPPAVWKYTNTLKSNNQKYKLELAQYTAEKGIPTSMQHECLPCSALNRMQKLDLSAVLSTIAIIKNAKDHLLQKVISLLTI